MTLSTRDPRDIDPIVTRRVRRPQAHAVVITGSQGVVEGV